MAATMVLSGCKKLEDQIDQVNNRVDNLEERVLTLEELCQQMNTNISSLQSLVNALQQNDYVTGVTPITKNDEIIGYTISFTKSAPITIFHGENGKDGQNGTDGVNGADGKDGHTPVVGVRQDTDGVYYWTVDGEWLLDANENKVKAVGTDGKDGQNGANGNDGATGPQGPQGEQGVTPQLKIENDYWYISYDNGKSWTQLGKATGDDGANGENGVDGDSMFSGIDCTDDNYVIFTLSDGTQIKLPTWYAFEQLQKLCNQMNTNISSLHVIVAALQNNDYVQSIVPLMENGKEVGYTITFTQSGAVNIYHGKDGANGADGANGNDGQNGQNGADGKDGHTPIVGVKQDTDGIYYWTIDGEWLLDDNGNKVKAVGTDGKDGANGSDGKDGQDGVNGSNGNDGATGPQGPQGEQGVTPQLKIEDGYWYVSYDNGASWKQLGKATGEDGKDGQDGANGSNGADGKDGQDGKDGDAFFQSVDSSNSDYVILTLADGTVIKLPTWYAFEQLQKLCNQMNTNISSLQTIVAALQNNDYVQSIVPLMENGKEVGYAITFTKSGTVNIYHGKDGKDGANGTDGKDGQNGQDGTNGTNGKDGHTPIIGVRQHTDGIYYWTVDGEWLLDDNGNKVKAVGTDGKDGANGADGKDGQDGTNGSNGNDGATGPQGPQGPQGEQGVTPQLKIENGYWYVSYDNGTSWKQLGKATGENGKDGQDGSNGTNGTDGKDGQDGDSFFKSVTEDENNVYITLIDGTAFTLPKTSSYLFNRLQSVSYVPKYSDGKATVCHYGFADESYMEMDFMVSPKDAVADIVASWKDIMTVKAVNTITRAVEFIDMPITSCSGDSSNGVISIMVAGENLPAAFFNNNATASAVLCISDGNSNITSEYIPLTTQRVYGLFYTSSDENIVTPANKEAFGANIVSNTYQNGVGIIAFDREITTIGEDAFNGCNTLTSITISDGITAIGNNAFSDCDKLEKVNISSLSAWCMIDFANNKANPLFHAHNLYLNNELLTNLVIPNDITEIKKYAFILCYPLENVTVPEGVTTIDSFAFSGCTKLTSFTIPKSVTTLGGYVFNGCKNITSVYCMPTIIPTTGNHIFSDHSSELKIYTPTVTTNAYKTAKNWAEYADIIEPYNFLYGGCLQIADPQLKSYLLNNYDDDSDYEISIAEAENITSINCSGLGISSLAGLEACANLTSINCANNNIATIELPYLEKLTMLTCYGNPLSRLNLSNCTALNKLNIIDSATNAIVGSEICIDGYQGATTMDFTVTGTPFTTFTFTNSTALTEIRFYGDFTAVNLYGNSSLESIDVSPIANLQKLDAHDCNLQTIDVAQKGELKYLDVSTNKLSKINVTQNSQLEYLNVANNSLTAVNVRNNTTLTYLNVSDNTAINTLDVTKNTALIYFNINNNSAINIVDVSKNTALEALYAEGLSIVDIDLTNNNALTDANLRNNTLLKTLLVWDACVTTRNDFLHFDMGGKYVQDAAGNHYGYPFTVGQYIPWFNGGVVCEISNEGANGKIISVDEPEYQSQAVWGPTKTTTNAKDTANGLANMLAIKALDPDLRGYPAFKWCNDYGKDDWYLPAISELRTIWNNKTTINSTLSANGHRSLRYQSSSYSYYYLSSTEYSSDEAYSSLFTSLGDSVYHRKDSESRNYYVRAVLAF